jgi:hypothetical protein
MAGSRTSSSGSRPSGSLRPGLSRPTCTLSVVLCTYDGERWIGSLLDSLAQQERLPDELIVQDDCSDDDTVAVVRRFAEDAPFDVRLEVNEQRLGSTTNFAKAVARAGGRYIALADQDDVWYPAKLRRLLEELEEDPTLTLVFSDADLIGEDGRELGRRLWETRLVGRVLRRNPVVPGQLFARRALTTGCTMMLRRRAVEAALPFPEELEGPVGVMRHDRWLSLVAAAVGTVRALPEPMLGFRVHPGQQTGVLMGGELTDALGRSAAGVFRGNAVLHATGLETRAAQLRVAAERAELLGDFGEAERLQQIALGESLRAQLATEDAPAVDTIVRAVRTGAYRYGVLGVGAFAADLVRVGRRTWRRRPTR